MSHLTVYTPKSPFRKIINDSAREYLQFLFNSTSETLTYFQEIWLNGDFGACFHDLFVDFLPVSLLGVAIVYALSKGIATKNDYSQVDFGSDLRVGRKSSALKLLLGTALIFCTFRFISEGFNGAAFSSLLSSSAIMFSMLVFWLGAAFCLRNPDSRSSKTIQKRMHRFIWVYFFVVAIRLRSVLLNEDMENLTFRAKSMLCQALLSTLLAVVASTAREFKQLTSETGVKVSAEYGASIFQICNFTWMNPIFNVGYSRSLVNSDLWDLVPTDKARAVLSIFVKEKQPSFIMSVFRTCQYQFGLALAFTVLKCFFMFTPAFFLGRLLSFIQEFNEKSNVHEAYLYCLGLAVGSMLNSLFSQQTYHTGRRISIHIRSIIAGEIYAKTLRKGRFIESEDVKVEDKSGEDSANENESENSFGEIVNLLQVDQKKVSEISAYITELIGLPIQIAVSIFYLFSILGWSALFGTLGILLIYPYIYRISKEYGTIENRLMKVTDKRLNITNEILQGIRIIKLFAWELPTMAKVDKIRDKELEVLWSRYTNYIKYFICGFTTPTLFIFVTFLFHVKILKNPLDAATIFTALTVSNTLRTAMERFPDFAVWTIDCMVSVRRLERYLNSPELAFDQKKASNIGFSKASFQWKQQSSEESFKPVDELELSSTVLPNCFTLNGLDFTFPEGKMTVIAGPTGSGKTSLLAALLGEMPKIKGDVFLPERSSAFGCNVSGIAYVAQHAWLQNISIRDNILFGEEYDPERYSKTVFACALQPDFELLEAGDQTEVGEKGITLSGGQKQRVSLARAIYSKARYILLDDCLSAVDAHTAKHIYETCLKGEMTRDRTVLLVTHYVPMCIRGSAYFVKLEHGEVALHGETDKLASQHLLDEYLSATPTEGMEKDAENKESDTEVKEATTKNASGKLTEDEEKAEGHVKFSVYKLYFVATGGFPIWFTIMSLYILCQLFLILQTYWLRIWSSNYGTEHELNSDYFLYVYLLIGVLAVVSVFLRTYATYSGSVNASKILHNMLLERIMFAKVRYFDTTPIGRIVNRFSKDMEAVDQELSTDVGTLLYLIVETIGILVVIIYVTPMFFFAAVLILFVFIFIASYYLATSRDLRRLESTSRSPLLTHFGDTVNGAATIRAFGAEDRFYKESLEKVDDSNRPYYLLWVAQRWVSWRVDIVGSCVSSLAGAFIVYNINRMDAGLAGFSLTYALTFTESILWLMRTYSHVEMNMNSLERVKEYTEVEQEPPYVIENKEPPSNWPMSGEIKVEGLTAAYSADKQPVLNNLSFTIKAGERVGIVGRTGSGKSTLAISLFRFIEPSSGRILIDDVDISEIGLYNLRKNLTIIPQDPILFTGSIRSNIDPFEEHSDAEIWAALKRSHLITAGERRPPGLESLDSNVSEGGNNFSQGQRQLLAMARALLRSSKVIIMDEATASVDFDTDNRIQQTIREEFSASTLLCIAHRLRTIIDYDKVVVMDSGRLVEYGTPRELLEKGGIFKSMCEKSGEYETLQEITLQNR